MVGLLRHDGLSTLLEVCLYWGCRVVLVMFATRVNNNKLIIIILTID